MNTLIKRTISIIAVLVLSILLLYIRFPIIGLDVSNFLNIIIHITWVHLSFFAGGIVLVALHKKFNIKMKIMTKTIDPIICGLLMFILLYTVIFLDYLPNVSIIHVIRKILSIPAAYVLGYYMGSKLFKWIIKLCNFNYPWRILYLS